MVLNNKVYIRDQPVRDLTDEEKEQVEEYRKKQEEYVEKWRQVMGIRMQLYGPQMHPYYNEEGYGNQPSPRGNMGMGGQSANQQEGGQSANQQETPNPNQQETPNPVQSDRSSMDMGEEKQEKVQEDQQQQFDEPIVDGDTGMGGGGQAPSLDELTLPDEPKPPQICAVIY